MMIVNTSGISVNSVRALWSDNPVMSTMMKVAGQVQAITGFPVGQMDLVFTNKSIRLFCGYAPYKSQKAPHFYIHERQVVIPVFILYGVIADGRNPS